MDLPARITGTDSAAAALSAAWPVAAASQQDGLPARVPFSRSTRAWPTDRQHLPPVLAIAPADIDRAYVTSAAVVAYKRAGDAYVAHPAHDGELTGWHAVAERPVARAKRDLLVLADLLDDLWLPQPIPLHTQQLASAVLTARAFADHLELLAAAGQRAGSALKQEASQLRSYAKQVAALIPQTAGWWPQVRDLLAQSPAPAAAIQPPGSQYTRQPISLRK